ncbi:MAG: hypothetical protein ACRCVA_13160 [Phreatobacter sp.]
MKRWATRRLVCLFLAVFITGAMGLSVVQASDMTAKMAIVSEMGASGQNSCQGCPAGGDDGTTAMACAPGCVVPLLAVLPQTAPLMLGDKPVSVAARQPLFRGRTLPPDPHPPRAADVG